MIPKELQANPPRDIKYTDDVFKKNRSKTRGLFIYSLFVIPLCALLFWLKFGSGSIITGVLIGVGMAALGELMGLALMMNAKKAVNLCQNGIVTLGTVQKVDFQAGTVKVGKSTKVDAAGYVFINVIYKDGSGKELTAKVMFSNVTQKEVDLKEGDQVPVIYLNENPEMFLIYSTSMGISPITSGEYT